MKIKIGVIGAGRAGSYYIKHLQNFDVEVMAYDPFQTADQLAEIGARKVELQELFSTSDLISIHAPTLPETDAQYHFITAWRTACCID